MRFLAWFAGFSIGFLLAAILIALAATVMVLTGSFILGAVTYFIGAIGALAVIRKVLRYLDEFEDWHRSYVDNSSGLL